VTVGWRKERGERRKEGEQPGIRERHKGTKNDEDRKVEVEDD
jgi:hypothetical protein